ncbi:hypothetical protein [Dictyobacter formicarum]|uniref:YokE-like PH domain-containing protein n=1 Tax=Dictyobacter formicarum TaxID=2778368 RepID=A0ABQ3VA65_9CHLR|nr:hypothetical protein [Dictyobacter formicarum]GHO83030.1 hypothetical protein KSZ_10360 [Dictyobacter formicarum]
MPNTSPTAATKIFQRLKGLQARMQPGEEPILALPAIWDGGQSSHSTACDVIITNQRVIGYYYRGFPRERIFIDSLNLADLRTVTWRKKKYEPVFREILVSNGRRNVYIRTPQQKSEFLYEALRLANDTTAKPESAATDNEVETQAQQPTPTSGQVQVAAKSTGPVYTREQVRRSFENSSLAVVILLVGGVLIEIISLFLLFTLHNASISGPLFIAGFVAVAASFLARRGSTK